MSPAGAHGKESTPGVSDSYTSYSHFLFLDTQMVRLPSLCNSTDDLYSPDGLHEELRPKRLSAVEAQVFLCGLIHQG